MTGTSVSLPRMMTRVAALVLLLSGGPLEAQVDSTRWVRFDNERLVPEFIDDLREADLDLMDFEAERLRRISEAELSQVLAWSTLSARFFTEERQELHLDLRSLDLPYVRIRGSGTAFHEAAAVLKEYYSRSLGPVEAVVLSVDGGATEDGPGGLTIRSVVEYGIHGVTYLGPFEVFDEEWSLQGQPGDTLEVSLAGVQAPVRWQHVLTPARRVVPWHLPVGDYLLRVRANEVSDSYRFIVRADTSWLEPVATTFSRRLEDFEPPGRLR